MQKNKLYRVAEKRLASSRDILQKKLAHFHFELDIRETEYIFCSKVS